MTTTMALVCSCGLPGSLDDADGDRALCTPCRRELRRQRVRSQPVERGKAPKPGGQSGSVEPPMFARLRNQADAVRELAISVQRRLPAGLAAIEVGMVDGLPTACLGASDSTSAVPILEGPCAECGTNRPCPDHDGRLTLTPVEAAAVARTRSRADHDLATIDRSLKRIALEEVRILRIVDRVTVAPLPKMCTAGLGRAGGDMWAGKCDVVGDPTRAGQCVSCWQRENAWRVANGLPERERTVPEIVRPVCVRGCGRPATIGRLDGLCDADRMADSRTRAI
jgi:hypothetical protein